MLNLKSTTSIQFKTKPKVLFCIQDKKDISKYEMYNFSIVNYKFDLHYFNENIQENYENYDVIWHYNTEPQKLLPKNKVCILSQEHKTSTKEIYEQYDKIIVSSIKEYSLLQELKLNNCLQIVQPIDLNVFGYEKKWKKRLIDVLVLTNNTEELKAYEDKNISIYRYEDIYDQQRLNQVFNNCKIVVLIEDCYQEQAFKAAACGCLIINNSEYLSQIDWFNNCKIGDGLKIVRKLLNDKNSVNNSIINSKRMLKYDSVYHCKQINKIIDDLIIKKQGRYLI